MKQTDHPSVAHYLELRHAEGYTLQFEFSNDKLHCPLNQTLSWYVRDCTCKPDVLIEAQVIAYRVETPEGLKAIAFLDFPQDEHHSSF